MSFTNSPLSILHSSSKVKILSIRVAEVVVILFVFLNGRDQDYASNQ